MQNQEQSCGRDIDAYAEELFAESFETWQAKFRMRKVMEICERHRPRRLVEIGCGRASIALSYKSYDECMIIEPATQFYDLAASQAIPRAVLIKDFFENCVDRVVGFRPDCVLCSSLLHEVLEPDLLLESIHKVCQPDTLVHINVPNSRSLHLRWAYAAGLIDRLGVRTERAKALQQTTLFDLKSLEQLMVRHGFAVDEKGSYFVKPFNHAKMSRCLDDGIVDVSLLDGLYALADLVDDDIGSEIFVNCHMENRRK